MIKKIIDYLSLRQAKGIELFFAVIPILSGYGFLGLPLQVILWALLFLILFFKPKRQINITNKPLILMVSFVLIHDFIYLFIANGNINAYIQQILMFGSILLGIRVLDLEKLKGSLNFIAFLSIIGLLYQWSIIAAGGEVHPIQLPFLQMSENRIDGLSIRPSSFFMEPAAYVAFMYIPLAFSLIEKKIIWTIVIILSDFLTTSTTGLLTSFIMLIIYVFTQRVSFKLRLLTIAIGSAMIFALANVEAFQTGVNKLEDTDVETNMRLSQGPYVVSTMKPVEMIAGAAYHNAYDYCSDGRAPMVVFYKDEVYMSTVWMVILKYGFIGLLLYLAFYFNVARLNRETIPLVVCLGAVMFSSGYGFGGTFVYTSIPLLLMAIRKDI